MLDRQDYLLEHAATHDRRLVVVTGPVLQPGDPTYRGVQIPLRFFKVAGYLRPIDRDTETRPTLAATGYLLDQTALVAQLPGLQPTPGTRVAATAAEQLPDLEAYRTYQVPVGELADLTGLDLGPLPVADRLAAARSISAAAAGRHAAWRELRGLDDIRI